MNNDWPYAEDGVKQGDFTEQFRFPIIDTSHPRWCYITAVVVVPEGSGYRAASLRPTDEELRIVASFHQQYIDYWYRNSWKNRMAEQPFDLDGQANGRYLIKRGEGDWAYRKMTWTQGPLFVPSFDAAEKLDLAPLLDRIHSWGEDEIRPDWLKWKADHPEVFAAVTR